MQPLAPRSPTLWLKCTRARSNISSTHTGISIIRTAMSGCIRRAPRSSRMRTLENTFPRQRAWRVGISPSRHRPQARFRPRSSIRRKTCTLIVTTIALSYYGPSHTDGDIAAYFVEADVLHTGDTWWNGHYPFIDYSTGGHIKGMIKAAEMNLAKSPKRPSSFRGTARSAGNQR